MRSRANHDAAGDGADLDWCVGARSPGGLADVLQDMRRLSRVFGVRGDDGRAAGTTAEEELESTASVPHHRLSARADYVDRRSPLAYMHRLVHPRNTPHQQAPPTAPPPAPTAVPRQAAPHRVGGTAMAQSPAPASHPAAPLVLAEAPTAPDPAAALAETLERLSAESSATATAPAPAPLAAVVAVEQTESVAAHAPAVAPAVAPLVAPVALRPFPEILRIPRTLPLGTTMIVQGLVQTIEVARPATHDDADTRNAPDAPDDTPNDAPADNPPPEPATSQVDSDIITPPLSATRSSRSPSSTDVLGLLLSIAAQATAEALVPWDVPPRSRVLGRPGSPPWPAAFGTANPAPWGREGIASGLAAAFSALAGAGGLGPPTDPSATEPDPAAPATTQSPITQNTIPEQPAIPAPLPPSSPRRDTPSRRLSSLFSSRRSLAPTHEAASTGSNTPDAIGPSNRQHRSLFGSIRRFAPWRSRDRSSQTPPVVANSTPVDEEAADFARAPPTPVLPAVLPESSVAPEPPAPIQTDYTPVPQSPAIPVLSTPPVPSPQPSIPTIGPGANPPTTDAEDLVRFSHMLGFTPGTVHPAGSFERFLADMQDELRSALAEYQERLRARAASPPQDSPTEPRSPALLDHTRLHIPSTDPLPLNWWRMYRFPELPNVSVPPNATAGVIVTGLGPREATGAGSAAPAFVPPTGLPDPPTADPNSASPALSSSTGPSASLSDPDSSPQNSTGATTPDSEPHQPVHPAIIIGLRSVSRDSGDDPLPSPVGSRPEGESGDESGPRGAGSVDSTRGRTQRDPWPRRLGLGGGRREDGAEDEEHESETERRARDGTRNYIIWIIGGYYPSNHPLLAHPNLFLGQVHPDELWMLNEFLGQVKPPTVTREDIAKAGLRVVKGTEIQELAKNGSVTENCTERCLICLDDYADEEDLRIMNCKHMFHKDCVDRWMETGRNNCPACRTTGVETT